ncbi:hypothetical protein K445DRAFT_167438 [Daldinia sp. EC12]|nr:hypothetical protein F4774DRAFT_174077 [Daldinia eschscholtzii]OTB13284.1 hypothetical protein K445DRAFT_167438 [Daldinia sp. EC12]
MKKRRAKHAPDKPSEKAWSEVMIRSLARPQFHVPWQNYPWMGVSRREGIDLRLIRKIVTPQLRRSVRSVHTPGHSHHSLTLALGPLVDQTPAGIYGSISFPPRRLHSQPATAIQVVCQCEAIAPVDHGYATRTKSVILSVVGIAASSLL